MNVSTKPSVHIHESSANPAHLSEICAGLEEEGIPYSIFRADGSVKHLAHAAANSARLGVGIGVTAGFAMLQIRNCPMDIPPNDAATQEHVVSTAGSPTPDRYPILHINLSTPAANSQCRALGTNAARAVKGGMFI